MILRLPDIIDTPDFQPFRISRKNPDFPGSGLHIKVIVLQHQPVFFVLDFHTSCIRIGSYNQVRSLRFYRQMRILKMEMLRCTEENTAVRHGLSLSRSS